MPLMNSTGAFKQQHFFSTTGGGPTDYINTITTSGTYVISGAYTSSGGTMCIGRSSYSAGPGWVFTSSNNGTFTNQLFISGTGVSYKMATLWDIAVDSSNNGYIVGVAYDDVTADNAIIFKVNSSLSVQWKKRLTSTQADTFYSIAIAGSKLYVGGQTYTGSVYIPILASYDTNGNLLFQKSFANCVNISAVATDSSNNYYAVAGESTTGSIDGIQVTKWNSSDVFQWGYRIYGASDSTNLTSLIEVDSSGNVYVLLTIVNYTYLLKLNSSGTVQWQKRFDFVIDKNTGMTLDDSGNVYVCLNPSGILNTFYIIKLSTSGSVVWQNKMVVSPNFWSQVGDISWRLNHLLVSMYKGGDPGFTFSLPDNGTKTGTYAPYLTYSTANTTISTSSLNISSIVNTSNTLSLTSSTGSYPTVTGNVTQSVTQI